MRQVVVSWGSRVRVVVVGLLSLAWLSAAPMAWADDLSNQETAKKNEIAQNAAQIKQDQTALDAANTALQNSQQQLADAQTNLASKQQAVQTAQAANERASANLSAAQATLAARQNDVTAAVAAVTQGQADLDAQQKQIGLVAQTMTQQNPTLMSLAMLLNAGLGTADVNNQVQWASMVFTSAESAIEQLQAAQQRFEDAQANAQQLEDAASAAEADVAQQKDAAAAQLGVTQQAEADAQAAQADVNAKVAANQQAYNDAQDAVYQSQLKAGQLQDDLAKIQEQIKEAQAAAAAKAKAAASQPKAAAPSSSSTLGSETEASAKALTAVAYALKQVGKAYIWGAAGPDAFDCSGLTMMAYKQVGISLPHGAQPQAKMGTYVARSDLLPGDLVFFYTPIEHVTIYIGDDKIVSASSPKVGIVIEKIYSAYNTARRYV